MEEREYFVYIASNHSRTLYVGVTNDVERRMAQHESGSGSEFARRYRINQLVYYEVTTDVRDAITREKEIKGWSRPKKLALIETMNPDWRDLRYSSARSGE